MSYFLPPARPLCKELLADDGCRRKTLRKEIISSSFSASPCLKVSISSVKVADSLLFADNSVVNFAISSDCFLFHSLLFWKTSSNFLIFSSNFLVSFSVSSETAFIIGVKGVIFAEKKPLVGLSVSG